LYLENVAVMVLLLRLGGSRFLLVLMGESLRSRSISASTFCMPGIATAVPLRSTAVVPSDTKFFAVVNER
jgi:hypothetical protein